MKPTSALCARLIRKLGMTTKQAPVGYYKGNRTGAMGRHTKHGGYIIDPRRVRTYVVPADLKDCELTPFVTKKLDVDRKASKQAMHGEAYLSKWKKENGIS